ncbi:class I SAM-dependent methyltransferase [Aquabacter sp. CN5-332]|uniref:class I SAM-dependent methyltransferase n=1 Tax=Aquabacter sp. CN5-332 TaxID=3156608 RepID=UPI0032B3589B
MQIKPVLRAVRASPIGPYVNIPRRAFRSIPLASQPLVRMVKWLFTSREDTNFTYSLTDLNQHYLAHFIALATHVDIEVVETYFSELLNEAQLRDHILGHVARYRSTADMRVDFGRRLGWYALARIVKPALIVETGVDKGLGSVVLCAALLKNGHGRFVGTDINPAAGRFLDGPYAEVGKVAYGDSIETLATLDQIGLFINDSDHSSAYEAAEYRAIAPLLAPGALVVSDNAHVTDELALWSRQHGRRFLFWREEPKGHWHPGGGLGISIPS